MGESQENVMSGNQEKNTFERKKKDKIINITRYYRENKQNEDGQIY